MDNIHMSVPPNDDHNQPRRPRGRPRKIPIPPSEDDMAAAVDPNILLKDNDDLDSALTEDPEPPERKPRGRPRIFGPPKPRVTRRKGRPRKQPIIVPEVTRSRDDMAAAAAAAAGILLQDNDHSDSALKQDPKAPERKPRGRPRKHPIIVPEVTRSQDDTAAAADPNILRQDNDYSDSALMEDPKMTTGETEQLSKDIQQLIMIAKQERSSKTLEDAYRLLSQKIEEKNKIIRQRTQMFHEQKEKEIGFLENFSKDQLKVLQDLKAQTTEMKEIEEERASLMKVLQDLKSQTKEMKEIEEERARLMKLHEKEMAEMKSKHRKEEIEAKEKLNSKLDQLAERCSQ